MNSALSPPDVTVDELSVHPVADLFPTLDEADFEALVANIRALGLLEPIWVKDGAIIDGRNRYGECRSAGVEPRFREYEGDDLVGFVVATNIHRRHLTESQRADIAAALSSMRQGERTDLASIEARSQAQTTALLKVSRSSVQRAAKVQKEGVPELRARVQDGGLSVSVAVEAVALSEEEQRDIASLEPRAMRKAVRAASAKTAHPRDERPHSQDDRWFREVLHAFEGFPRKVAPDDFVSLAKRRGATERLTHLPDFVKWAQKLEVAARDAGLLK